jgi:aspartyl-tRNA(Asn)/glutamyl-tRNA(Gln) amidotransferase subunit C
MLDPKQVEHVATLARLALSAAEKQAMTESLAQILAHFEELEGLDTSDVEPTAQVIPLPNVMREDVVEESLSAEDVLANAPRVESGHLAVPAVLPEDQGA